MPTRVVCQAADLALRPRPQLVGQTRKAEPRVARAMYTDEDGPPRVPRRRVVRPKARLDLERRLKVGGR